MDKILTLLFTASVFTWNFAFSDTLKVLQYNLLYYGQTSGGCTSTTNPIAYKDTQLKIITGYIKPDIFTVNEMGPTLSNSNRIKDSVLNKIGYTTYSNAPFIGTSNIMNMLYYNNQKLSFYKHEQVSKDLQGANLVRPVDFYTLYLKNPVAGDTTFITCLVAHLKAGSTTADKDERLEATKAVMARIAQLGQGNFLFLGDFNIQSSSETSYQEIINYSVPDVTFMDPINKPGSWNNNSTYAAIHTQSPRSTENTNSCFVEGGSDDRFDFILASKYIMNNTDKISFVSGSYRVVGQDGLRFNQSMINPVNNSEPADVIQAMYNMSDHYPVYMELKTPVIVTGISELAKYHFTITNPVNDHLTILFEAGFDDAPFYEVLSLDGRIMEHGKLNGSDGNSYNLNTSDYPQGFYFLSVKNNKGPAQVKRFIKL